MSGILLLLDPFRFSIATAAYDAMTRSSGWEWPEQAVLGAAPVLQYTGPKADTISLAGRLLPGTTGGVEQLARMRALGDLARPLFLIDGMGRVHGNWVIDSLTDTGSVHLCNGMPRLSSFDLTLKKYDDGQSGLFGTGVGNFSLVSKASKLLSLFR